MKPQTTQLMRINNEISQKSGFICISEIQDIIDKSGVIQIMVSVASTGDWPDRVVNSEISHNSGLK